MKSSNNRSRLVLGGALLLGTVVVGPRFCSEKSTLDQAEAENSDEAKDTPKRKLHDPTEGDDSPASASDSIQEVQNAQSEEVILCIQDNARNRNLDVDCKGSTTEMKLPGSEEVMEIKQIECIAYDEEGHPESKVHTYIGPSCEPDGIEDHHCDQAEEITFMSVTSEVPLGSYPELNLPSLESGWGKHPLTDQNSTVTAFADAQADLSSETDSLCASTLELLTHLESPQNIRANDFSRELMNVSDFLVANGMDHELPEDSRLFTPFPNVEVHFENEAGIPMSCSVDFEKEQLNCSPSYPGYIEEGAYVYGEGWNRGLEDPNCAFSAPLDDLWDYNQQAVGVRDCVRGYIFTADPF